jgi:hypothetical protein
LVFPKPPLWPLNTNYKVFSAKNSSAALHINKQSPTHWGKYEELEDSSFWPQAGAEAIQESTMK